MPEIKATGTVKDNMVYLITDPVGAPIIDRPQEECAVYDNYLMGGAVCYRVCGEIPKGKRPKQIEFFTRISHQEDRESWVSCDGQGCEVFAEALDMENGKLCGYFRMWKGQGEHRDLMMKVELEP